MAVHTRRPVRHADFDNGTVRLVTGTDGAKQHEMKADHVLAATGYRIDVDTLSFLSPALRPAFARVPVSAAPALFASLEASIPGLYFTGSLAAPTFGPLLRFVAGSHFAARAITASRARRHAAR
ncbi:hypothetical protein [Streptomyces sp. NPDC056188]|uniref:hypothetical protein n=1 Tax=Streptomyces sp. NPDC056188 TaxID=3345740 RepID=UPI0035D6214E